MLEILLRFSFHHQSHHVVGSLASAFLKLLHTNPGAAGMVIVFMLRQIHQVFETDAGSPRVAGKLPNIALKP